jgi:tRNA pseudouridine38-40 synthase
MKLPRIALLIEYVGKKFHGSQYQLGLRTVQADVESALSIFLKKEIRVIFSGRTDAGVHAYGQVAHADIPDQSAAELDLWRLTWAMNGILKNDVAIRAVQFVPDLFHSRFQATSREYVYRILNRPQRSAIMEDNHYFIPRPLNLSAMQQAAEALLGVHDFIAFRSQTPDKSSTICNVSRAEILNKGEGQLEFWIAADHFVYNMVRIIAGTLVEIGLGKKAPESLSIALNGKDRNLAGITAPARGLTLQSVGYPDKYNIFQAQ